MRSALRATIAAAAILTAGCDRQNTIIVQGTLSAPQDLTYELNPSGTSGSPASIVLNWTSVSSPDLASYRVYSRGSTSGSFGLRAETTSPSFTDAGVPDLQYFVTAVDGSGNESPGSNTVTVDAHLTLEAPDSLFSTSLNGAIELDWTDNAYLANPSAFKWYRVYSASYSLASGLCGTDWALEGATVSPDFIVGALTNGVSRCYGVSAIDTLGDESLWSPLREDTPRPDARNVALYPLATNPGQAGFLFWDGASTFGLVENGNTASADFYVYQNPADSTLWLVPQSVGTDVQQYGTQPIDDLTSIDVAPDSGYAHTMVQAKPGYGYVFQIGSGPSVRYGAVRVTHVGRTFLILDWSFQTAAGNPELVRRAGMVTAAVTGTTVHRN